MLKEFMRLWEKYSFVLLIAFIALGLVPYDYKGDILSHPDCIQCGQYVNACPKKAIGYNINN
jgi:ferredoxin